MKKQEYVKSEYAKLIDLLSMYEKILHPDIFNQLIKQMHAAYEENKTESYRNANISDDALWIEKELDEMKTTMLKDVDSNHIKLFRIRCFYKSLLKKFFTN
jgi:hypothetical protein